MNVGAALQQEVHRSRYGPPPPPVRLQHSAERKQTDQQQQQQRKRKPGSKNANATGLFSYEHLLQGCSRETNKAHAYILQSGIKNIRIFSRSLIKSFGTSGSLQDALRTFDLAPRRPSLASWLELITAFAQSGHYKEAVFLFRRMLLAGSKPTEALFIVALDACRGPADLEDGTLLHGCVAEAGLASRATVAAALISMYGICGEVEASLKLLDETARQARCCWNAVVAVLVQHGREDEALEHFHAMQHRGIVARKHDYVQVLKACYQVYQVEAIHAKATIWELDKDLLVAAALVEAYGRSGSIKQAVMAFDVASKQRRQHLEQQQVMLWNLLISAYARNGRGRESMAAFHRMQARGLRPVRATFEAVLEGCASEGAVTDGKLIHDRLVAEEQVEIDGRLGRSLIDMYSASGFVEDAWEVFAEAVGNGRDELAVWNSMLAALARHQRGYEALRLFEQMQQAGLKPDEYTFENMLLACCLPGLMEAGLAFYLWMRRDCWLQPARDRCHSLLVELVARSAGLEVAEELANRFGSSNRAGPWMALLGAARSQGNLTMGKRAAAKLFMVDPGNSSANAVLLSLYSKLGRQDVVQKMRSLSISKVADEVQDPVRSWIEVNGVVHDFGNLQQAEDQRYAELRLMLANVKELMERQIGTSSNDGTDLLKRQLALHDVEAEGEFRLLWSHGELLAVALGMLNTLRFEDEVLRVFKNARLCPHCHSVIGFISMVTQRQILVRDSSRFHMFDKSSSCSCGGYW